MIQILLKPFSRIALRGICFTFALALGASVAYAQQSALNSDYLEYIRRYSGIAIQQMREHKIPASITMAQAILESSAGRSELAQKSNNHFGIKRGSTWTGPTVTHNDDRNGEHFRKYDTVLESYEDHSRFLLRERYQRLFRLNVYDYKGWAHGLKACGYATSPTYATRLIALIENYRLYELDTQQTFDDPSLKPAYVPDVVQPKYEDVKFVHHKMTTNNDVLCIQAQGGETWDNLSSELRISKRKLLKLNEAEEVVQIRPGDFIYLEKKQTKGPKMMKNQWHKVRMGESMYSISQLYGIRIASLYKLNFKEDSYLPAPGDLLRVR